MGLQELQGAWGGVGSRAEKEGVEGSAGGKRGEERRGHLKKCYWGLNWAAFLMFLEKCK